MINPENLSFSVILSIDAENPKDYFPKDWDTTENNISEVEPYWKHLKGTEILDKKQFDDLVEELDLHYECESMGSVGTAGFGVALVPAISFISESSEPYINMNVTPFEKDKELDWDEILEYMKENY